VTEVVVAVEAVAADEGPITKKVEAVEQNSNGGGKASPAAAPQTPTAEPESAVLEKMAGVQCLNQRRTIAAVTQAHALLLLEQCRTIL